MCAESMQIATLGIWFKYYRSKQTYTLTDSVRTNLSCSNTTQFFFLFSILFPFIQSFTHSFIHSFLHSFIFSFFYSSILSFFHSFPHTFMSWACECSVPCVFNSMKIGYKPEKPKDI